MKKESSSNNKKDGDHGLKIKEPNIISRIKKPGINTALSKPGLSFTS